MSEIQYCEDCKSVLPNIKCNKKEQMPLAKCKKSPFNASIRFVLRGIDDLDLYEFCTSVRTSQTCPKFEAKDG